MNVCLLLLHSSKSTASQEKKPRCDGCDGCEVVGRDFALDSTGCDCEDFIGCGVRNR